MFKDLEERLQLRALLARKKTEQFSKFAGYNDKNEKLAHEKFQEKNKILERLKQNYIT
jgi:hypothetical protein